MAWVEGVYFFGRGILYAYSRQTFFLHYIISSSTFSCINHYKLQGGSQTGHSSSATPAIKLRPIMYDMYTLHRPSINNIPALAHARVARHSIECFMKMQLPSSLEHVFICTTFGPPNCIDHKTYASGKQLNKSGCARRRKSFIANGSKASSECQRKTTALVAKRDKWVQRTSKEMIYAIVRVVQHHSQTASQPSPKRKYLPIFIQKAKLCTSTKKVRFRFIDLFHPHSHRQTRPLYI